MLKSPDSKEFPNPDKILYSTRKNGVRPDVIWEELHLNF